MAKYKWFLVVEHRWCDAEPIGAYGNAQIVRGLRRDTVERRYIESDFRKEMRADYGGAYATQYDHVAIAEFDDEETAYRECKKNGVKFYLERYKERNCG